MEVSKERWFVIYFSSLILLVLLSLQALAASCGSTLTSNTFQSFNIGPCLGNGLVVGANDIIIDCNGKNITGDGSSNFYGIKNPGYNNVIIKNCGFTNFTAGIRTDYSNNITIINNTFYGPLGYGIWLYNSSNSNVSSNKLYHSLSGPITNGIFLYDDSNNNKIHNNNFSIVGEANVAYPVVLQGASPSRDVSNNSVYDNYFMGSQSRAVYPFLREYTNNNTLYNNYLYNGVFMDCSAELSTNKYNTSYQARTNILGGPYVGGNYYSTLFEGTGNITDANDDGIIDYINILMYINGSIVDVDLPGFPAMCLFLPTAIDYLTLNNVYGYINPVDVNTASYTIYSETFSQNFNASIKHSTGQYLKYQNSSTDLLKIHVPFNQTFNASKLKIEYNNSAISVNLSGVTGKNGTHQIFLTNNNNLNGLIVCPNASSLAQVNSNCNLKIEARNKTATEWNNGFWLNGTYFKKGNFYEISNLTGTGIALGTWANLTIYDDTESTTKKIGDTINFYARYNDSANLPIPDATCIVRYHDGTQATMAYTSGYYTASRTYSESGIYNWNVTCNKTYYDTLTTTDTVNVSFGCGYINSNLNFTSNLSSTTTCFYLNASNIVVDGKGFSLISTSPGSTTYGFISARYLENVTIKNLNIVNFRNSIRINASGKNYSFFDNNFTGGAYSTLNLVHLKDVNNSYIYQNTFNSSDGVSLYLNISPYLNTYNNRFYSSGSLGYGVNSEESLYCNFTNNNFSSNGARGYSGSYSHNAILNGNNFSGTSSILSYFINSNSSHLLNNHFTINRFAGSGIYLQQSNLFNITDNILYQNNDSSNGIYLYFNSNYNVVSSNNFLSTKDNARGYKLRLSSFNNLSNGNLNFTSYYGIPIELSESSSNNYFINEILSATTKVSSSSTGDNYIINASAAISDSQVSSTGTGKVYIQWYLDALVKDNYNALINSANLTTYNSTNGIVSSSLTNSSGRIPRQTLTQFYESSSTPVTIQPYTLNATLTNYYSGSTAVTLTSSQDVNVTITSVCGYINADTTLTQNNYSISGSCFVINQSNIVFDGSGSIFSGDGTGVGISAASGITNVTVRNINMVDFEQGVHFNGTNSTLENLNLSTASSSSASYSVYFGGSASGNNVTNSFLGSTNGNDTYSGTAGTNYIINSSLNRGNIQVSSGTVYVMWYLTVASNVGGSTINVTDSSSNVNSQTPGSGIYTFTSIELYKTPSTTTYQTPHTINVTATGYLPNGTTVNLTQTNSTTVNLNLAVIPAAPQGDCRDLNESMTLSGGITYSNSTYCLRVTANDIVVDGNGSTIVGNGSITEYGLYSSTYTNVTVYNLTILNFTQSQAMLSGATNFNLSKMSITTLSGTKGIYLSNADGNQLSGITINGGGIGVSLDSGSDNNQLSEISSTSSLSYAGYLSSSYNDSIRNSNFTGSSYGIYLSYGGQHQIHNNRFVSSASNAAYLYSTTYNNISSNLFNITSNYYFGSVYLYQESSYNNFTNNIVYGDSAGGTIRFMFLPNNNLFEANNITGTIMTLGLYSGNENIFRNNMITATGHSAISISQANNTFFYNGNVVGGTSYSVYSYGNVLTYLTNVTHDRSKVASTNGTIYVRWYLDLNVTNTSGSAIDAANADIKDYSSSSVYSGSTNSSGDIPQQTLLDFFQNASGRYYYTPHNLTAVKVSEAYRTNSTLVNLTQTNSTTATIVLATDIAPTLTTPEFTLPISADTPRITASTNYSDAEGDSGIVYFTWYINNVEKYAIEQSVTNGSVASSTLDCALLGCSYVRGGDINVTVYANDGYVNSDNQSKNVSVGNAVPTLEMVQFIPSPVRANQSQIDYVVRYHDSDNDTGTLYHQWYVNGTPFGTLRTFTGIPTPTTTYVYYLMAWDYKKNDAINVTVWAGDGIDNTTNQTSETLVVQNTPPVIDTEFNSVTINTSYTWTYDFNATDIDVDESIDTLTWSDNTALFDINPSTGVITFAPNESQIGTTFILLTVNDTTEPTDVDTTGFSLTIEDTTNPSLTVYAPTSTNYTNATLLFNYSASDANLDRCYYQVDDTLIIYDLDCNVNEVNVSTRLSSGDHTLHFYAVDNNNNYNYTNVTFTINLPPTFVVSLTDPAYKSANITATISPSELDGGNVYLNWSKNGVVIKQSTYSGVTSLFTEDLNLSEFNHFDNISIAIWGNDTFSFSSVYTDSVNVSNTAPANNQNLSNVSLTVSSSTTINLSEYFIDIDSDDLNYSISSLTYSTTSIDQTTNILTLTGSSVGSDSATINASDRYNTTQSNNFTITVSAGSTGGPGGPGGPHEYFCEEDEDCADTKVYGCEGVNILLITTSYKCVNASTSRAACVYKANATKIIPCEFGCSNGNCLPKPLEPTHGKSCSPPEILINGTCQNVTTEELSISDLEREFNQNYYPTVYRKTSLTEDACLKKTLQAVQLVDSKTYDLMVEAKNRGDPFTPTYRVRGNLLELIWAVGAYEGERCVEFDINTKISKMWSWAGLEKGSTLVADRFCFKVNGKPLLITQQFLLCEAVVKAFEENNAEVIQQMN